MTYSSRPSEHVGALDRALDSAGKFLFAELLLDHPLYVLKGCLFLPLKFDPSQFREDTQFQHVRQRATDPGFPLIVRVVGGIRENCLVNAEREGPFYDGKMVVQVI